MEVIVFCARSSTVVPSVCMRSFFGFKRMHG